MVTVESSLLRPDHPISRVIKGGWQLAGDHGSVDRRQAIADMTAFLDAGITTFDCADIYAGVEDMIGAFIEDVRQSRGMTASRRVCIHTKLVPDMASLLDLRDDEIETIVDRSLMRLGIEQLHLVQFYWWDLSLGDPWNRLAHLIRLKEKGKIRHVAMTNFDETEGERFIEAGIELISTQLQYSLLDRRPAKSFAAWAAKRDVAILAYGTLAGGFLSETWLGRPDPGFAFQNRSLVKYRLIIDEFGSWDLFQDLLAALKSIGVRHSVSLSAVASRWVLDQPQVAAAIVGARYASHLPETLSVFDIKLDAVDLALIDAVLERAKGPGGPVYGLERDRQGRHGRIMKYNLNTNPKDAVLGSG